MTGVPVQDFLVALADQAILAPLVFALYLFQNDHVPAADDVAANYVEADFDGYPGPIILTWGLGFLNAAGAGENDAALLSWTKTAGIVSNTVYGAYALTSAGDLMFAERFDAPILMGPTGALISYLPRMRFSA